MRSVLRGAVAGRASFLPRSGLEDGVLSATAVALVVGSTCTSTPSVDVRRCARSICDVLYWIFVNIFREVVSYMCAVLRSCEYS